jgi:hypothetical protein
MGILNETLLVADFPIRGVLGNESISEFNDFSRGAKSFGFEDDSNLKSRVVVAKVHIEDSHAANSILRKRSL